MLRQPTIRAHRTLPCSRARQPEVFSGSTFGQNSASKHERERHSIATVAPGLCSCCSRTLSPVDLPVRRQLATRGKRVDDVYFIEAGIASVVGDGSGKQIEIGIIGPEGMTGLVVVMGADRAPHDTFMQIDGKGLRISAAKLREA